MKLANGLLGLVLAFGIAAFASAGTQSEVSETTASAQTTEPLPTRILFVGNSYLYYNDSLHNHLSRMVGASGLLDRSALTYKSATIGGAALRDHDVAHLVDPASLRVDEPFELVILQGQSAAALSKNGRRRFADAVSAHARTIRAAGGEPVLYMTPAYAPEHRSYREDMTERVAAMYNEAGKSIGARVIPVGLAFEEAARRRPGIVLHKTFDNSHPSMLGTYLAAATVFATLYDTSPVGIDYTYFGEVTPEDARFLQQVAQDVVSEFEQQSGR